MTLTLQILGALAIILLMVYLIPLLIQLRKTAAAVEELSISARKDLGQILVEVQAARARVDEVAELAKHTMERSTPLSQIVAGALRGLPALMGRSSSKVNLIETLLAGVSSVVNLFRRAAPARPKEDPS